MTAEPLAAAGAPEGAGTPRLEVRGLSKTFSGITVLDDAYLSLAPGEIHGLVGQNGSGKSTLIKLISGVYKPDPGGDIFVDGERIGPPVRGDQLHLDGVSFVHQDLGLVNDLTVRENVRVGRHATRTFASGSTRRPTGKQLCARSSSSAWISTPTPRSVRWSPAPAPPWRSPARCRTANPAVA